MVLTFKCDAHDFQCEEIGEWDEHNEEYPHTTIGIAPCSLCGISTEFEFTGKKKAGTIPCLCEDCKGNLK